MGNLTFHFIYQFRFLKIDRHILDIWVDRLREWIASKMLQPLLNAFVNSPTVLNNLMKKLQVQFDMPTLEFYREDEEHKLSYLMTEMNNL